MVGAGSAQPPADKFLNCHLIMPLCAQGCVDIVHRRGIVFKGLGIGCPPPFRMLLVEPIATLDIPALGLVPA